MVMTEIMWAGDGHPPGGFSGRRGPPRYEVAAALQANLERGFLESDAQFRQILEGMHDVVSLTNATGSELLFVNEAYERLCGQSRAALYASPLAFLDCVHAEDLAAVRVAMTMPTRATHDIEFRIVLPDGDVRWVWSRGFPVRSPDGEVVRIVTVAEDVTERRRVVESHRRLVRGFTHDVKNPLGAADGYLALLEMGVHGELPERQAEVIRRARRCISTAHDLVVQLLEIERADAGQLVIERARVDLGAIARDTVGEFRAPAAAKRQRLALLPSRPGDSLIVATDPARVRQILANLVSNAVKYTQPDGHISVRAHVASDAEAPWPGRWLAVDVIDNGPGIPLAKQGMLFREFTRFDPGAAEGSGIGLAISQRVAFALGATITFTSTPGLGSTFTLWLPGAPLPAGV
jgi:PAS domain S-box-containing protein